MNTTTRPENKTGGTNKFDLFFHEYSRPMLLYALSFVNSKSDAEDIVQEVFYNFWKSKACFKVPADEVKLWLFRAVKNACINFSQKKDILRNSSNIFYIAIEEEEYSELNENIFTRIRQDIENMPAQTREIVKAVFYRKEKYREVAERLGISLNTVKTLLSRAMQQLRKRYTNNLSLFLYFLLK